MIYYNTHSLQAKLLVKEFNLEAKGVYDINEVPRTPTNEIFTFIGFIYNENFSFFDKEKPYWISNFNAPENYKYNDLTSSFVQQALDIGLIDNTQYNQDKAYQYTQYFNFKQFNYELHTKITHKITKELDELKEKCYYSKVKDIPLYLLYENNGSRKLPLAHHILQGNKGIVVIISQTRSDNDILTLYCSNVDKSYISNVFGKEFNVNTSILSTFIPSHISVLGNQLKRFMEV